MNNEMLNIESSFIVCRSEIVRDLNGTSRLPPIFTALVFAEVRDVFGKLCNGAC